MSEENYNKESCDMKRVADDDSVINGPPGAFSIERLKGGQSVMFFKLPNSYVGMIRLRPIIEGSPNPSWEWDSNEDKPTLKPSVHLTGRWHGWFKNGRMQSC